MPPDPYAWIDQTLQAIHRADWYRSVQAVSGSPGSVVTLEGQKLLNFASNDYLGLAGDERLIQAAIAATQVYGTGSTGSRLLSGHRELHHRLEQAIADLKQTAAALVFSSGYLANLGTISALVGARDLIVADQYNHASLKSGAALSGATVMNYPHSDLTLLRQQLQQHRSHHRRCLMLTDSVFSMDGDLCRLPDLLAIAESFDAMLLIDEAHATGVLGERGSGGVEHFGCTGRPLIQIGTLSKALGSLGGYVAGTAPLIDLLRNRAPTWIYTTGLSPADTAAALAAVQIVTQEPQRRQRLWQNVQILQQMLQNVLEHFAPPTWKLLPSESPILCLQVEDAATVLSLGRQLRQWGVWAAAVRPPTVPTSRLRFTVMATHTPDQLQQVAIALQKLALGACHP
ncbi:8-amino-7-oxononanoate synthase [Neosynechococcus sphagnicola sy1]|uniref:8-amino-7-ketopelargonate synthase n=1 Tax=Neosynechococcus sphagnicola sy1 TaxID=1497020 RepID=A0A098TK54_9CYAN|nr:8-amino-7-oxononanoate synthase [Neosynechococcus sphagnicola]KGF72715.1 8-amino-7-oxononanoate synthase [Neosynechococcus sphagnicola sy1]